MNALCVVCVCVCVCVCVLFVCTCVCIHTYLCVYTHANNLALHGTTKYTVVAPTHKYMVYCIVCT